MGADQHPSADLSGAGLTGRVDRALERWASAGKRSPRRFTLVVILVALGIGFFSRFPGYAGTNERPPGNLVTFAGTPYGRALAWWLDHPFQPVPVAKFFSDAAHAEGDRAGRISHLEKLTVRGVFPLLNQLLRGGIGTILLASSVAAAWAWLLFYRLVRDATHDPAYGALAVWAFAACWAGQSGFEDFIFGDAVAVALLLACARSGPVATALLLLVAGFTDERALTAAPLVGLLRSCLTEAKDVGTPRAGARWHRTWLPVIVGVGLYAIGRLWLAVGWGVAGSLGGVGSLEVLLYHFFVSFPTKVFRVWEFLWLFPLALLALKAADPRREEVMRAAWFFLAAGCAVGPALLVWDIERSLTYFAPGILLALVAVPLTPVVRRRLLAAVALASFAWIEFVATAFRYLAF